MKNMRRSIVAIGTAALIALGSAAAAAAPNAAPQVQPGTTTAAETISAPMANADFPRDTAIHRSTGLVSGDGRTVLTLRQDGNLVVLHSGREVWRAPGVNGNGQAAYFQNDGNFVVYDGAGTALWHSSTWRTGHTLSVQDDGNVVIYDGAGRAVWHTNTAGR